MKKHITYYTRLVWTGLFLLILLPLPATTASDDMFDRIIKLPKTTNTRYQLLEKITHTTGLLFIYDSSTFDDEVKLSIQGGKYSIHDAIYLIIGNPELRLQRVGNHILIKPGDFSTKPLLPVAKEIKKEEWFTIEGSITDIYNHIPIPSVSVHITGTSIGTISNFDGKFRIHIPDSLLHASLHFSHLGYHPLTIENEILKNGNHTFGLEPKVIPLQEVVVRVVPAKRLIEEMLDKRENNFASEPVHLTTFYREGIEKRKTLLKLTEGVFKVNKTPFYNKQGDQVKLLKMRQYQNVQEKDTIITRMKAGIHSSLLLDLIKNIPDFLEVFEPDILYTYTYSDMTVIDNRLAHVITFEPLPNVKIPLYRGEIYIDNDNSALLMVRFEIDPAYIEKATSGFIEKKTRGLNIKAKKISYTVSYKPWNETYYINHIRGDLHFQVRKKRQLFNSSLHTWFEMVTCGIDTTHTERFTRKELVSKTSIFSEMRYTYDHSFWENFNTIIPEEELYEALSGINTKLEEITD